MSVFCSVKAMMELPIYVNDGRAQELTEAQEQMQSARELAEDVLEASIFGIDQALMIVREM